MIRVILGLCAMKLLGQEMHEKLTTPCPVSIAMNTHDTDELPQESPRVPTTFPSNDDAAKIPIPAWRRHVHLYAPIIGSIFAIMFSPTISQILRLPNGLDRFAVVASFAIPTYLAASTFYPSNRPEPTPKQSIRFTRKNDLYRAAVLATYGRIFDEPSDVIPYLMDVLLNYGADQLVGERPTGTKQRRSEFLVALLWIIGSRIRYSCVATSNHTCQSHAQSYVICRVGRRCSRCFDATKYSHFEGEDDGHHDTGICHLDCRDLLHFMGTGAKCRASEHRFWCGIRAVTTVKSLGCVSFDVFQTTWFPQMCLLGTRVLGIVRTFGEVHICRRHSRDAFTKKGQNKSASVLFTLDINAPYLLSLRRLTSSPRHTAIRSQPPELLLSSS
jgi:hypothetical protein